MEGEQVLKIPGKLLESISGSLLVFPLRVENQIIGVLTLGSKEEGYFTAEHLRLTELIADQSAIIIDNATLYQRIREAVKELEKLNKMKNEFISVVSHELRTPITTIMGFNNILLKEDTGPLTDQQRRFLKISEQSANRLSDLINDLLDISRIESGRIDLQIVPTDIPELLHKIETLFTKECKAKKISLTLDIQDSLPSVCVDQDRMLQVFKHLVQNSVKFTDPHGKITISASDRGDYIQLDFADTGAGITKENHEKIFDKFYQVDTSSARRAGGTGLGLSIVRSIVELHGGKIWIESQLGKGSVFKLIIPKPKLKEGAYEKKGINR
jgi:signal transduction histidine kinase